MLKIECIKINVILISENVFVESVCSCITHFSKKSIYTLPCWVCALLMILKIKKLSIEIVISMTRLFITASWQYLKCYFFVMDIEFGSDMVKCSISVG